MPRHSFRQLRRSPGYAAFAVLTLGLAIGCSTAVYAVIDALLMPRQSIAQPERVMNLYHVDGRRALSLQLMSFSWPDYQDLLASQRSFSAIAGWHRAPVGMQTPIGTSKVFAEAVTGDYFNVLGVVPALGRALQPVDDGPGAPAVAVISQVLWKTAFNSDPSIDRLTLSLNGVPFQIVGVMPSTFRGVDMPTITSTPLWISLAGELHAAPTTAQIHSRRDRLNRWLLAKARLKPGVTVEDAQRDVSAIAARIDRAFPLNPDVPRQFLAPGLASRPWAVVPMGDVYVHESMHVLVRPMIALLLTMVNIVLLVACSNLSNLTLARTARRAHELSVKLALGASRWRIMREHLCESAMLTAAGWVLSMLVARTLLPVIGTGATMNGTVTMTLQLQPELHPEVVAGSLGAAIVAWLVMSSGPVWRTRRRAVSNALTSSEGTSPTRWRGRGALIAMQVAACTLLLLLTAAFAAQVRAVHGLLPAFDLDRLAVLQFDDSLIQRSDLENARRLGTLLEDVRRTPGVEHAALMSDLPLGTSSDANGTAAAGEPPIDDNPTRRRSRVVFGSASLFDTTGVRLVVGAPFVEGADDSSEAVISAHLAEQLFGAVDAAIGGLVTVKRSPWAGEPEIPAQTARVVGVAADADGQTRAERVSVVYLPAGHRWTQRGFVVARTTGDPAAAVEWLRTLARRADPDGPIVTAATGMAVAGPNVVVYQVGASIAGALGIFAALLAATGLFGVVGDVVQRRTREIGIRLALGAAPARVLRAVVAEAQMPVVLGIACGGAIAFLVSELLAIAIARFLPAMTFETIGTAVLPIAAAALVAAYIPARRASRVEPVEALREHS